MTPGRVLRAATIALFATAASAASPSSVRAQDFSCERGDLEVRGLEFRGNRAIDDDELAVRVSVTPSSRARRVFRIFGDKRCLDRRELALDIIRLQEHYARRGYHSAQVDTLVQPVSQDAVRVAFLITEGEPTVLEEYTVTGLDSVAGGRDILRRLQLRVGQPFDRLRFAADIDTIMNRLRDAGYYHADRVQGYDVDTTGTRRASAFVTVMPGPVARFGAHDYAIETVPGRDIQIDTGVVRRVMGINTGQVYSDRAILDAQRNLFQLGAYRHIEVTPLPDSLQPSDTIVRLHVRLTEDLMRQLDSELGWATLDCVRVRLQYTDRNFLGTARRLQLSGQSSKIGYGDPLADASSRRICDLNGKSPIKADTFSYFLNYSAAVAIQQPRLLGTRWVPALSVYSERRGEYKAYLRTIGIGADLSATRDIGDRTPFRLGYTFEYGQTEADPPALCALFNRCDPESRQQIQDRLPLGVANATVLRMRTDNPISPTRGTLMRAELRSSASGILGTDSSLFFNKATGDVAWYTPVGSSVLTLRLRGGAVLGRRLALDEATPFVPPQERLYAGGPTSVRGFQQNELGSLVYIADRAERDNRPIVDSTIVLTPAGDSTELTYRFVDGSGNPSRSVPLGGNGLLVTNIELRIPDPFLFPRSLQYALFVDGGDVWDRSVRRLSMKWTPGIGLRALTPFGPFQVNVGYNHYRRESGAIYYNPNVFTLACATPGIANPPRYRRVNDDADNGPLIPVDEAAACPQGFTPSSRERWYQRLAFTFSIGPEF